MSDSSPSQAKTRLFELEDEKSSKFWEVCVDGNCLTTRWGRIGTQGQSKTKELPSSDKAAAERDKLVAQKTKKGYVEVASNAESAEDVTSEAIEDTPVEELSAESTESCSATVLLSDGIDELDPKKIRAAVSQLDMLPEDFFYPLKTAVRQCLDPRAEECVKVLVELGADINGDPDVPILLDCVNHVMREERQLAQLRVALSLGADVNITHPRSGDTALYQSAAHKRKQVVALLMEHGADPAIVNKRGESAITHVQERMARENKFGNQVGVQELQEILTLLTGETVSESDFVRPIIAQTLGIDVEMLSEQTRFFDDLAGSTSDLWYAIIKMENVRDAAMVTLLDEVAGLVEADDEGRVTHEALSRISESLPEWTLPHKSPAVSALYTLGLVEAVVEKAGVGTRPKVDEPRGQSIMDLVEQAERVRPFLEAHTDSEGNLDSSVVETIKAVGETLAAKGPAHKWIDQLSVNSDERKLRLLLAGILRVLFGAGSRFELGGVILDAIEALELFADTGELQKELKALRKSARGQLMDTRRTWRNSPRVRALDESLDIENPIHAIPNLIKGLGEILEIPEPQAEDEFAWFVQEYFPGIKSPGVIDEWRSTRVQELAESMYLTGDFRQMFQLADALQQAGCDDRDILAHCRDPLRVHSRGCWVIDSVLDGRWATIERQTERSRWSHLSRYPVATQHDVRWHVERFGCGLPLEEYLQKRWDVRAFKKTCSPGDIEQQWKDRVANWAKRHPYLTADQIEVSITIDELARNLRDYAFARRAQADNPSDAVRSLHVLHRLQQASADPKSISFLDVCAVRNWSLVDELQKHWESTPDSDDSDGDVSNHLLIAILCRDSTRLNQLVTEIPSRKVPRWQQALYTTFTGVVEQDTKQVANGLFEYLRGLRRMTSRSDLEGVIFLPVHGLHRLIERFDASLVADFDTQQEYPWDAAFHTWCQENQSPIDGMDLSDISSMLHEIVIDQKFPIWLCHK
jgi:predicted DNA-binding WGR domain protein